MRCADADGGLGEGAYLHSFPDCALGDQQMLLRPSASLCEVMDRLIPVVPDWTKGRI